jgi:TPP-dependent pyruvate/acetoin dehydrogenase alpha subunit
MDVSLTKKQKLELYYFMKLNRSLEDRLVNLFKQNKVVGGLYGSLGQEATSVGTAYALGPGDWIAPMIRNVGALLVRGYAPRDILTQYMARYTSPTLGKDGTSHFGDLKVRHVVSPISMLGDLIPVMTGVAMAGRYLGQKIVTMTWIGDGGTSTGAFHEGMNLAAVQKAPFVLVIENNGWAYSTPVSRQVPVKDLADRAKAYGIQSYIMDGNDVIAVYETTKKAVDQCRAGDGPIIIESKTMRMRGHAQHDPAEYVPKEMFAKWKKLDPLERYEKYLTENKLWDEKAKKEIDARIDRELTAELEIAERAPFPPPELAEQGVYCEGCHEIEAVWKRPKDEVMPPKSSVDPVWKLGSTGNIEQGEARGAASAGTGAEKVTAGGRVPADAKPHFEAPVKTIQKTKPAKTVAKKPGAKKTSAKKISARKKRS